MTELTKNDEQNIELLKQQALGVIQSLAGDSWSDHNNSDPGITILEVLAVAIQDLSNQLALPIEDLLSHHPLRPSSSQSYQLPQQLLPSNAVTLKDYRRLIIDVNGVKGADIRRRTLIQDDQTIKTGLYDVVIDFNDNVEQGDESEVARKKTNILSEVRQRYLNQRNINEDIGSIKTVKKFPVTLALSMTLDASVEPLDVVAKILNRIKETISPEITRYQYSQLLDQGLSGDEIFQGPLLSQGFILDEDLNLSSMPESLYSSDISSALENVSGLKALKAFKFISDDDDDNQDLLWRLAIPEHHLVSLDLLKTYQQFEIEIDGQYYKLPEKTSQELVQLLDIPVKTIGNGMLEKLSDYVSGQYHELSAYASLQHQIPKMYALAEQRLDDGPITQETAKILQLKAYLALFDQVLADEFSQLDLLKELLAIPNKDLFLRLGNIFRKMLSSEALTSNDIEKFCADIKQLPITRNSQPLQNISGVGRLLGDFFNEYTDQGFQTITEPVFSAGKIDRLKRSCEHLFSRFSETTLDASLLKYKEVFTHYLPSFEQAGMTAQFSSEQPLINKLVTLKQVVDLVLLLNDYPKLSRLRTGGFNYLKDKPRHKPSSGLVKRITAFLGIEQPAQLPLSTKNQEGIYLLESELLRFGLETDATNSYVYKTSQLFFIAPQWPTRFDNSEFISLLERQIVKESPVHQQPHIVYLNREDMSLFERLYFSWLNAMTQLPLEIGELGEIPETFSQKDQENLTLIESLCGLLRQFVATPEKITLLILNSLSITQLKSVLMLWLMDPDEEPFLTGETVQALQDSFYDILLKRFDNEADSKQQADELFQQIMFTLCQAQLDTLIKPNPIKTATIGQNFRVGYKALNFLKPAYPVPNGVINPDALLNERSGLSINQILLEQPVFTLGIKQPHRI
jgi:hypothetical protein